MHDVKGSTSSPGVRRVLVALGLAVAMRCPAGAQPAASAPAALDADVLIQAGHQGRPDCGPGGEPPSLCANTGSPVPPGEIAWTPIIADEATRVLRRAGVRVLREPGHLRGPYRVRIAVFVHVDGADSPCSSAASVGYGDPVSGRLADAWKSLYGRTWPFGFKADNFTEHLRTYYGFHHVHASDGAFVLETGEMSCPRQYAWLRAHLRYDGDLLAFFVSRRLGEGNVPLPTP